MADKYLKIAYIGGGSRAWARKLMCDLAVADDICGEVRLYDIDKAAAKDNEAIGNTIADMAAEGKKWNYLAVDEIDKALKGCDAVVISVMPGTLDEMESDVNVPYEYGIYQPVGDTVGAGGYLRAMRCVPMFRFFAAKIRENCPSAWVINYTNPMTLCTRTLYEEFPKIKAFGCCHEVFGTQELLAAALKDVCGIVVSSRDEIKVDVCGINHFTWITKASYKDIDLFEVFKTFGDKYAEKGFCANGKKDAWLNNVFECGNCIKFELFRRYGVLPAAGDRHLSEFMPQSWFLESPEKALDKWKFALTPVSWRRQDLKDRLQETKDILLGKKQVNLGKSGEEGVKQLKALFGMGSFVTNINLPNYGQMKGYPTGAVVETNGLFGLDGITPMLAKPLPEEVDSLILRHVYNQEAFIKAAFQKSVDKVFAVYVNDPQVSSLSFSSAREMFDKMVCNTEKYLKDYWF